jgi:hypothetical protein
MGWNACHRVPPFRITLFIAARFSDRSAKRVWYFRRPLTAGDARPRPAVTDSLKILISLLEAVLTDRNCILLMGLFVIALEEALSEEFIRKMQ